MFEHYEDNERLDKMEMDLQPFLSPYQDYRHYSSSVTPEIQLSINVIRPSQPGNILVQLHGWHMSMPKPQRRDTPGGLPYLVVQVDMRGRAFSEGQADCNGYELIDIYDAVQFVLEEYADHIKNHELIYLEGGSGGGGNVLATVAKFPDMFAAATALYGIADYAVWYEQDQKGEFQDDMDVWIGCKPAEDKVRYASRSGIYLAANLHTPLYIAHGDGDIRVPVTHSRTYISELERIGKAGKVHYDELAGVGAAGHLAGATEDQLLIIQEGSERNRQQHHAPILLAPAGTLYVGGYVYTKYFQVHLQSVDQFAVLHYDLPNRTIRLVADLPYIYSVKWADERMTEGTCRLI